MTLSRQNRLGSSRDFGRVHRKGLRAATPHLALRALKQCKPQSLSKSADGEPSALSCVAAASLLSPSQFGISISRKVSKRAVVRNRMKRQIKAIIRQELPRIEPGWQVVIVVRPAAVECEFADFLRELEYLLKKLRITTDE
ncbi:MAG: ribonuclease P protein component [Phormidesmis sp. RL_2_1]|nr:ribonuclease P protein component [Phormidesmis sp. RL_2_1]